MRKLTPVQLKSLAEFGNTIAAAWFTAGVVSPFFTKPKAFMELLAFGVVSLLMTWAVLRWSLSLLEGVKS